VKSTPTSEKNKILCLMDFSLASNEALNWAINITQKLRAHLCIMFVYRMIPSRSGELLDWKKNIEEETLQRFSMLEKQNLSKSGVPFEFKIEIGFINDRVRDYARKNDLLFVVMDRKANINNTESIDELLTFLHVPLLLFP